MRMPFGKHKHQPLDRVKADTSYVAWLAEQPWFRDEHPTILAYLTGGPEHPIPQALPKRQRQRPKPHCVEQNVAYSRPPQLHMAAEMAIRMNATVIDLAPYIERRDKAKALGPRGRTGKIIDPANRNWQFPAARIVRNPESPASA